MQLAWFRVSKIPADQRSIRTLAKVGGLVGKVIEIDEGTRYRYDYVRLRIACRDVARVPKTAEGTLGMYIIDFGFEREVLEVTGERVLKSGIKFTSNDSQPPAKRSKADNVDKSGQVIGDDTVVADQDDHGQRAGKQIQQSYKSAPPKIVYKEAEKPKFMHDAQKSYNRHINMDDNEKVHIPDTMEESESDSESFTLKV